MLSNSGPVGKLYMSIIEDVIENVRDIILDEGLEDEVLDDLKRIWASKVLQSKALEDLWNNNITHSKFVLKLPANYNASDQDRRPRVSVGIPSSQNVHHFPFKKLSDTLATFSLPPGLSYPVQIPAGVTLQTASGHLYKVNVPVVVTQGPGGAPPFPQTSQKTIGCRGTSVPQPAAAARPVNTLPPPEAPPPPVPPALDSSKTLPRGPNQDDVASQHTQVPPAEDRPAPPEVSVAGGNQPGQEPPFMEFLDLRMETLETLAQAPAGSMSKDIDDILKEVIENELNKAVDKSGFDNFPELSDIVQLDGPFDNSDTEAEDEAALEDNDFLGIISAQAMQGADGSSPSSSSGSDEPVDEVELDPLDSGDDVTEQYVPDPFDTDNVIVCQFDKIHRSKNRWKFHLKDGVMCYGGRDYVFSKAVGEAEW